MIRYHTFSVKAEAEMFLKELRSRGGMGYMLTMNDAHHEVRELY